MQVLPVQPCRGLEDWNKRPADCGWEDIWDHAWEFASNNASKVEYGMAINSPRMRTQHQVSSARSMSLHIYEII